MDLKITPSGQTIVKPTALGPVANTDSKLLIYGLFQKGRVLAQDGGRAGRKDREAEEQDSLHEFVKLPRDRRGFIGSDLNRLPVALQMAFAIAGATQTMGVSPAPAEGKSLRSRRMVSSAGRSLNRGTRYCEKKGFSMFPSAKSIASNKAPPIPMITAPST